MIPSQHRRGEPTNTRSTLQTWNQLILVISLAHNLPLYHWRQANISRKVPHMWRLLISSTICSRVYVDCGYGFRNLGLTINNLVLVTAWPIKYMPMKYEIELSSFKLIIIYFQSPVAAPLKLGI